MKSLKIGLFGYGCVGTGLYKVLEQSNAISAQIKKICIKDSSKKRNLPEDLFTTQKNELLDDPEINVIVELIDDSETAFDIVCTAMERGKSVVSANKKMIAEHLPELLALQKRKGVSFLYEGACCASIPIIRNLEEYYDNDLLTSIQGIFNGSTNFILTELMQGDASYDEALARAQSLGFAETDPALDVEGYDAKYKLTILLFHAFGILCPPDKVFNYGITKINSFDISYAKQHKLSIKLIAFGEKTGNNVYAFCLPTFVKNDSLLGRTENEYNAVILESSFSEQQVLYGKGAGDTPTGSAVLSDISAVSYDYKYESKKYNLDRGNLTLSDSRTIRVYVRYAEVDSAILSLFDNIHERYESSSIRYFIGDISISNLRNTALTNNPSISIIRFSDEST